ncbi:cobalamin biosynthesis protein [Neiella marina]|uniref:Cobalamin biosynthesis protein n=1 Tax=Neiella holothuriorum TaxID=2870530 RepID=A0ABS7EFJ5_9GAMM|nr:cobalamin biosynthesis protein [Neiella holothuriorum]MBW8191119.1 cobalamin biosynthesis protein [Neiella holothuriorum]
MEYVIGILINRYDWLWVITAAIIAERLLPIPAAYHPRLFIRNMAQRLQQKVLVPSRSPSQQTMAGVLAALMMLLFVAPLPILAHEFAPYPMVVDTLLLMLCLQWQPMKQQLTRFANTNHQQKQLKRTLLSPWLARDCGALSELGLNKGAVEAIYLRSFTDQVGILFWYVIAGIYGALGYWLLLELSRQWHPRLRKQHYFGSPLKQLRALLDVLPQSVWALWLALSSGGPWSQQHLALVGQFRSKARALVLVAASKRLGCELGGPAMYQQRKFRQPRLAANRPPQASDVITSFQQVNWHLQLLLSLIWAGIVSHTFWVVFAGI